MTKFDTLLTKVTPLPWTDETGNVDGAVSYIDPQIKKPMNIIKNDIEGYNVFQKVEDAEFVTKLVNAAPDILALLKSMEEVDGGGEVALMHEIGNRVRKALGVDE